VNTPPAQSNPGSLAGRLVIVTGGSSGIGAAIASEFVELGCVVASIDILAPTGLQPVHHYPCDLLNLDALERVLDQIGKEWGSASVLVNNAGDDTRHSLDQVAPADWDRIVGTNLRHMFFAAQHVARQMKASGTGGAIVNLGSIAWMIPETGMPVYLISKAAVHGLTRSLARELGSAGIRVNTVAPGWVMTERQQRLWLTPEAEAQLDEVQMLPGRIHPSDVAHLVAFLASDNARMITAQQLIIDGGRV